MGSKNLTMLSLEGNVRVVGFLILMLLNSDKRLKLYFFNRDYNNNLFVY